MKKKLAAALISGILLTLLALGTAGCETLSPAPARTTTGLPIASQQNTGIWVSGEGKVSAAPDVAILSLGIEAQANTGVEAQTQAATAMTAVAAALDANGVAKKDIQTQRFSIQQITRWDNDKQQEIVLGYRVDNMVTAKVRNVDSTGDVIDASVKAGGDNVRINSISFTVEDPSPYLKKARKQAMDDAAARAKQLADAAGVKLGAPIYINESGGLITPPVYYTATPSAGPVPAPAPPPTPISQGETEIQLTVQVVYSIK